MDGTLSFIEAFVAILTPCCSVWYHPVRCVNARPRIPAQSWIAHLDPGEGLLKRSAQPLQLRLLRQKRTLLHHHSYSQYSIADHDLTTYAYSGPYDPESHTTIQLLCTKSAKRVQVFASDFAVC